LTLSARERLDLCAQRAVRLAPLALERLRLLLRALERRAQRLDELRDGGLALLQSALRQRLIPAQRLAREAEEELAVGAQRLPGQRVERGAQVRIGLLRAQLPEEKSERQPEDERGGRSQYEQHVASPAPARGARDS
jgi:hypothetical protein